MKSLILSSWGNGYEIDIFSQGYLNGVALKISWSNLQWFPSWSLPSSDEFNVNKHFLFKNQFLPLRWLSCEPDLTTKWDWPTPTVFMGQ